LSNLLTDAHHLTMFYCRTYVMLRAGFSLMHAKRVYSNTYAESPQLDDAYLITLI